MYSWFLYEADGAPCSLGQLRERPEEIGILADPHLLIVASDLIEDGLVAELRRALGHPREAREEPPSTQVPSHGAALWPVFDIHCSPDASRIAHSRVDLLKQSWRE